MENKSVILVVDDEPRTLNGVCDALSRHSKGTWSVLQASDGYSALQLFEEKQIDVLITDIRMPGMDGVELLRKLREKGIRVVTIFLTAYADFSYAQSACSLGAVDYALKPMDKTKLCALADKAVHEASKHRRMETGLRLVEHYPELAGDKNREFEQHPILKRALEYIAVHFREPLSLKDVASVAAASPAYLSTLMKKKLGRSFVEELTTIRIADAKDLLHFTELRINEIADRTGFQSDKYFIQVFKTYEGVTPKQYRNQFS